jgi:nitroreductase
MHPTPIAHSQLLGALNWRYATKVFDSHRQIPADVWAVLEESLVLSASAFGLQPYRFLIINDPATRAKLMPHAWGQRQVVDASHFVVFAARTDMTEDEIDALINRMAKVRGVPTESLAGYRRMMTSILLSDGFKPIAPHWTANQAYLALGNLLTSAALLGIDTCPMEGFARDPFNQVLGLPAQGLTAVVCCALGYRSREDKHAALPKVRLPKTHLVKTV